MHLMKRISKLLLASGFVLANTLMNGRRAYRDNFFERQAYKIEESGVLRPDL